VNPVLLWFHRLGSPPLFDAFAARWVPWCFAIATVLMLWGGYEALFVAPTDYKQGDGYRILFIHVPSAWMSLMVYALMALYAGIALVWKIKLCEILAMACAPVGAVFTAITLATGAIWGYPMWGTWWDWDPRMTSELVLLFLYLGVIGLNAAIEDRRAAARAAGFLAIMGIVLLPVIRYSVDWWGALHQQQTIRLFGESAMHASMFKPLIIMVVATKFWFVGSLLQRARVDNLRREAGKAWARAAAAEARA
jgi:heme exporter protein C